MSVVETFQGGKLLQRGNTIILVIDVITQRKKVLQCGGIYICGTDHYIAGKVVQCGDRYIYISVVDI